MKQSLLILICLIAITRITAQAQENKFETYGHIQDSLMVADYKARDIKGLQRHLNELLMAYNKLNAKDKADYKGMINGDYYNLACTYALLGDKKNAIASLQKSGYDDYGHMLEDTDLDILRDEPAFKQYLQKVRTTKSAYLVTLQKDAKYNAAEKREMPGFMYQAATDTNLVALKKAFNLDSIAGKGPELTRYINLMHWVHNTVTHNGSKSNPKEKNAMNMLTVCTKEGKTCNCRGLAIILNEVYLAEGFKSRFVTCLPKDTSDQDCHVITVVYSKAMRRWIWMDPTFDAYVMDESGDLLGVKEVRERMLLNKPLILNPEANWNHKEGTTKEYYLGSYMAKNLYRVECPVYSAYNYDTYRENGTREYIELRPVTYRTDQKQAKNKTATYINHFTNNDVNFWAAPQL